MNRPKVKRYQPPRKERADIHKNWNGTAHPNQIARFISKAEKLGITQSKLFQNICDNLDKIDTSLLREMK